MSKKKAIEIIERHVLQAEYLGIGEAFISRPNLQKAVINAVEEALNMYVGGGETHQPLSNEDIIRVSNEYRKSMGKSLKETNPLICYDILNEWGQKLMIEWDIESFAKSHKSLFVVVVKAIEEAIYCGMGLKNAPITPKEENNLSNNTMEQNNTPISPEELEAQQTNISQALEGMVKALTHKLTLSQQTEAIRQLIIHHNKVLSTITESARDDFNDKAQTQESFNVMLSQLMEVKG
mgnify:CR=1 FL=1